MPAMNENTLAELLPMLDRMDAEDAVHDRARLERDIPRLLAYPAREFWPILFENMSTRFNTHLFLNAPELWVACTWQDWREVMSSGFDRSYRASGVFDTGKFDDVKLLYKYVGVDSVGAFLQEAGQGDRVRLAKHLLAILPLLVDKEGRDEDLREGDVFVTERQLDDYRRRLMQETPAPAPADFNADRLEDLLNRVLNA